MSKPSDPLDSLLEHWGKATPPVPDHLESEVWRRIALSEDSETQFSFFERVEAIFSRPSFTATFIAACMLLGLFLAEARVSHLQTQRNIQVVQNYLRLIDPLLEASAGYPIDSTSSRP